MDIAALFLVKQIVLILVEQLMCSQRNTAKLIFKSTHLAIATMNFLLSSFDPGDSPCMSWFREAGNLPMRYSAGHQCCLATAVMTLWPSSSFFAVVCTLPPPPPEKRNLPVPLMTYSDSASLININYISLI